MADIVDRLKVRRFSRTGETEVICSEAAVEIERLREALSHYASANNWDELPGDNYRRVWLEPYTSTRESYNGYDLARAALGDE